MFKRRERKKWICLTTEFPLSRFYKTNEHHSFYAAAIKDPKGVLYEGNIKLSLPTPSAAIPFPQGLSGLEIFALDGVEILGKSNFLYKSMGLLKNDDVELRRIADKIRRPLVGTNMMFGDFYFHAKDECSSAQYLYQEKTVEISFSADSENAYQAFETALNHLANEFSPLTTGAKAFACDKLLASANDWNPSENTSGEISKDRFLAALSLESIHISSSENLELVFSDGGLFAGHIIIVNGSLSGSFRDAGISG